MLGVVNVASAQGGTATNWSGFYVGASGGYLRAETEYTNPATPRQELSGAMLGAQLGYNFQFNQIVVGAEADWSRGNLDTFIRDGNYLTYSGKIDMYASLRLRAGVAIGSFLPYVTVGRAWTRLEQGSVCPTGALFGVCALTGPFSVSSRETFSGWVYGLGAEYAISRNWTIKAEALFTRFSDRDYTATVPVVGTVTTPVGLDTSPLLRAGINFRF